MSRAMHFYSSKLPACIASALFLVCVFCLFTLSAYADDVINADVEPNNSFEQAQQIEIGQWYSGALVNQPVEDYWNEDYDYYTFDLSEPSQITIPKAGTGIALELYDGQTRELLANNLNVYSTDLSSSGTLSAHLAQGYYYLKVRHITHREATYSFIISADSAYETFPDAQGGSNNSISTASNLTLNTTCRGQIALNDRRDYFRFALPSSGHLVINTQADANCPRMHLFNNAGVELDSFSISGSSKNAWEGDLVSGAYYLAVYQSERDPSYLSESGYYSVGNFTFSTSFTDAEESFSESQTKMNNTLGNANNIQLNKAYTGQLALNDDVDIFQFNLGSSGVARLTAKSSMQNTQFEICDAYGSVQQTVKPTYNNQTKEASDIQISNCGTGTHYLRVKPSSNSSSRTGKFNFKIEEIIDISNAEISVGRTYEYTGKEIKPSITVTLNGKALQFDTDYSVEFRDNVYPGTATVLVKGKGNYTGTANTTFSIIESSNQESGGSQNSSSGVSMHRLYNPNSGEHFYTSSDNERNHLISLGWNNEGEGWTAPRSSNTPVYRLYNANGGEHHYTYDYAERSMLIGAGWDDEGIGWYSDDARTTALYREYNPNAYANNHNYTTSWSEHSYLVSLGWHDEGYAWYGI